MINQVAQAVYTHLSHDKSGHGFDHIKRVWELSQKFAEGLSVNQDIVSYIALLHDVDDYKLVSDEEANQLTNTRRIMTDAKLDKHTQGIIIQNLQSIGYNKRIAGMLPPSIEGKIVSDADMCDAMGVNGIIRAYTYSIKQGVPFFDKQIFPTLGLDAQSYKKHISASTVCHLFEKILKLKDLMLTEPGKQEAIHRHDIIVSFLKQLFIEENTPEWTQYLNDVLTK